MNIKDCQMSFQLDEAKSIMPPGENEDWHRWDGTTYHGWSILAVKNLKNYQPNSGGTLRQKETKNGSNGSNESNGSNGSNVSNYNILLEA